MTTTNQQDQGNIKVNQSYCKAEDRLPLKTSIVRKENVDKDRQILSLDRHQITVRKSDFFSSILFFEKEKVPQFSQVKRKMRAVLE